MFANCQYEYDIGFIMDQIVSDFAFEFAKCERFLTRLAIYCATNSAQARPEVQDRKRDETD